MSAPLSLVGHIPPRPLPTRPTVTQPTPMHPDTRASDALHAAVAAAWDDGHASGQWHGHLAGWRNGLVCGVCWGAMLMAIGAAASRSLGWL